MNNRIYNRIIQAICIAGLLLTTISCNKEEDSIKLKTLEEYKLELSSIVSSEKTKVENCVVGYNKGDFRNEALFVEVSFTYIQSLLAAELVLAKPDLSIAEIVQANKSITSPGKTFNDNLYSSDRRPIHELIVYCDTLVAHTPEGLEAGMCPPEPRNAFKAEISTAKTVRSAVTTIERQVTDAVIRLNAALDTFNDAVIK